MCEFGLSPQEAWGLTVEEYSYLSECFKNKEYRSNYRAAMIVSAIYNVNRGKERKNKPFTPEEILGVKKSGKRDMLETAKQWVAVKEGED